MKQTNYYNLLTFWRQKKKRTKHTDVPSAYCCYWCWHSRTGTQSWDQSHIEPGYIFGSVQSKAAMSITDQSDTIILSSSNISVCKKVELYSSIKL